MTDCTRTRGVFNRVSHALLLPLGCVFRGFALVVGHRRRVGEFGFVEAEEVYFGRVSLVRFFQSDINRW
jgi:hypothetical protein